MVPWDSPLFSFLLTGLEGTDEVHPAAVPLGVLDAAAVEVLQQAGPAVVLKVGDKLKKKNMKFWPEF